MMFSRPQPIREAQQIEPHDAEGQAMYQARFEAWLRDERRKNREKERRRRPSLRRRLWSWLTRKASA